MANGLGYVWVIFGNRLGFVWVSRCLLRPTSKLANLLISLGLLVVLTDFFIGTRVSPAIVGQREELEKDELRLGLVPASKAVHDVLSDRLFGDVVPVQKQVVEAMLYDRKDAGVLCVIPEMTLVVVHAGESPVTWLLW